MTINHSSEKKPTDEELLASLGYKQEFKREFTPLEVFGVAFSIIGLVPSIASVLFYTIAYGGGPAMVWGWAVASIFILAVALALAELGSAAPTSGGVLALFRTTSPLLTVTLAVLLDIQFSIAEVEGAPLLDRGIDWPDGFAFILGFNTPLWTICSFASSVNISEEASNAATAVPWGMTMAVAIGGIAGFGTPVNAVLFDGVLALLMGCLVFAGDQAINAVFALSIVGNYIAYSIPIATRFLGQNDFKPGPFNLGRFSLPVTTAAIVFMTFMSVVFLFPMAPKTDAQGMNYVVVVLGGTMLLSIMWYYCPKYGGVNWFTGPVPNVRPVSEHDSTRSSEEVKKGDVTAVDITDVC
ncbi:hypothetical protein C0993_000372 [Termitomyces sp. T159_Od127]|nr:hypothetical protein C0993_000372 [Termitomyces sp. T159_Od127]